MTLTFDEAAKINPSYFNEDAKIDPSYFNEDAKIDPSYFNEDAKIDLSPSEDVLEVSEKAERYSKPIKKLNQECGLVIEVPKGAWESFIGPIRDLNLRKNYKC